MYIINLKPREGEGSELEDEEAMKQMVRESMIRKSRSSGIK